jgi:hypothetical protein
VRPVTEQRKPNASRTTKPVMPTRKTQAPKRPAAKAVSEAAVSDSDIGDSHRDSGALEDRQTLEERNKIIKATRHKLQEGISLDEIRDKYWAPELKQFCREHGLKTTLRRTQTNLAVFNYLNHSDLSQRPSAKKMKLEKLVLGTRDKEISKKEPDP